MHVSLLGWKGLKMQAIILTFSLLILVSWLFFSVSLLLLSCSPRLLWGGVGHLVFGQERCPCGPRGTTAQLGSCGSAGRASIQLCPGFGFWHGPVPGEQNNSDEAFKNPLKRLPLTSKVKWPPFLEWYSNLHKEWQQDKTLPLLIFPALQGVVCHSP